MTKKNGKTQEVPEVFDVNNYEDSYLGSASLATATTYSDNSVFAQLGMQVGPENVAATAEKMGIETDLSSDVEYSIEGGHCAALQPGDDPRRALRRRHPARDGARLQHAWRRVASGSRGRWQPTPAARSGSPGWSTATARTSPRPTKPSGSTSSARRPGSRPDRGHGRERGRRQAGDRPGRRLDGHATCSRPSSPPEPARTPPTGEPTWGKTGTTDDNGDAWFCGATEQITVCVWVGHADSNTPMLTEYAGAPVDGGTIPALIFADVVDDFEALEAARKEGEDPKSDDLDPSIGTESSSAPATDSTVAPESGATEAVPSADTAPADGGGASDAAAAPSSSAPGAEHQRRRRRAGLNAACRRLLGRPRRAAGTWRDAVFSQAATGSGRERYSLPAAQKRHGSSVARGDPDPRPGRDLDPLLPGAASRGARTAPGRAARRFGSSPIPSASVSLPGPGAELARSARARAAPPSARSPSAARAPGSGPPRRSPRARRRR